MNRFEQLSVATTVHNNGEMCLAMLRSFEECVGEVAEIVIVDDSSAVPLSPSAFRSPVNGSAPVCRLKAVRRGSLGKT